MAGGPAHHLAQRRHHRAEHAGRGPLCARVRRRDLRWHRRDRRLRRDGAVRGRARPGGARASIRVGCGWFGHGVFPWYVGSAAASSATAGWRPAGTLRRRMGGSRPLADAQHGRRQLPAAAARGGCYRSGPMAGPVGCTQAEPPAASVPLLCDGMTGGWPRPGQGCPPCGHGVADIHRVTAAARPGSWPGSVHQAPARSAATRHCERHGHQRPG
jgi:hypothetical protein